jgi:hypothetical protein
MSFILAATFLIVEGDKIILDPAKLELIKSAYTYKIETPMQNEGYNLLLNLKEAYAALRKFTNKNTIHDSEDTLVATYTSKYINELVYTGRDGEMEILTGFLSYIKDGSEALTRL